MCFRKSICLVFLSAILPFGVMAQQQQGGQGGQGGRGSQGGQGGRGSQGGRGEMSGESGGRPQRSEMGGERGEMMMGPQMMNELSDEQRAEIMERFNVGDMSGTATSTTPSEPARNIFSEIREAEKRIAEEYPTEYTAMVELRKVNMPAARDEFTRLYRLLPVIEKPEPKAGEDGVISGARPERGEMSGERGERPDMENGERPQRGEMGGERGERPDMENGERPQRGEMSGERGERGSEMGGRPQRGERSSNMTNNSTTPQAEVE